MIFRPMNKFEGFKANQEDKKMIDELCRLMGKNRSEAMRDSIHIIYALMKLIQKPSIYIEPILQRKKQEAVDKN